MVIHSPTQPPSPTAPTTAHGGLVVGNYCHDVLIRDHHVTAHALGGAPSFIIPVLHSLSLPFLLLSKVGSDFSYSSATTTTTLHPPIVVSTSQTTVFHAHFLSATPDTTSLPPSGHPDRILKRVGSCDPITPSDLPSNSLFLFGLAVGVAGEILPETLQTMLDLCDVVFVDAQAIIRTFDPEDGTVSLVNLNETGFFHLLPRIAFLKCSAEEAIFVDIEEARKWCCVVVTCGRHGCEVFWKDGELKVPPFAADQVDPTGAGDSFLGGFAAGIVMGLGVWDAALLGNFFGSLAVAQVGPPKLDAKLFQVVKDEMQKRKIQDFPCLERRGDWLGFRESPDQDQFYESLAATKTVVMSQIQEPDWNLVSSPKESAEQNNSKAKLPLNYVQEEPIPSCDGKP
ncbi:hypothetical protein HN51_024962 [Arachis hypogaea]|uniref:Carbohydrate kinase PfkB domain-containing protein n=1 Tax=Arachis hypogaea TaxID=3818 RepID=A0A445C7X5_ARAHY|nr:inositol 3-kinase [Arachis hypogaea]QHO28064.1 Inositol 3-kinase [Arachis hypogaea]RYR46973.1 hypothetical protein Ahy_A07g032866 [Arachis hypogaea]